MKLDDLDKMMDSGDFIPGIFNYCDRWCERCPFTTRCMNFAIGKEDFSNPELRDIDNEKFWDKMETIFRSRLDLLRELAEERGIDIDALETDEAWEDEERRRAEAEQHSCAIVAEEYANQVDRWFEDAHMLFRAKEEELNTLARLNVPTTDPEGQADDLNDAVEVVRWYQHQIFVKLVRAFRGRTDENFEEEEDLPKDSEGSTKVALIGMDRSIAAWGRLLRYFPDRETETLEILVHLDRLRRTVEQEFPAARTFVRPGFDTMDLDDN